MSDLITRLHREAERRGVATTLEDAIQSGMDWEPCLVVRHPLEIAHDVLAKLKDPDGTQCDWSQGETWCAWHVEWGFDEAVYGTFLECVVALAEAEHE